MSARFAPSPRALPPGSRAVELRRYACQALGRCDWPLGALVGIAQRLRMEDWPDGGEGARLGVDRALAGVGNLRLQLLGALALPGWREATLSDVAGSLIKASGAFEGEEMLGLRLALRGLPA